MERIIDLEARPPYRLFVRGPVFEPLRDPAYFARVRLSEYGAPIWPNGLVLAPDALYERIRGGSAGTTRSI